MSEHHTDATASAEPVEDGTDEPTPLHRAVKITLNRAEGPSDSLDGDHAFAGDNPWQEARNQLRQWSYTAPRDGSVDKTDFAIVYDDGSEYTGTFGLTFDDIDLGTHMRRHLEFCIEHADQLTLVAEDYRAFLDTHELDRV